MPSPKYQGIAGILFKTCSFAEATQADLATFGIAAAIAPSGTVPMTLSAQLNQILLEQAAQQPPQSRDFLEQRLQDLSATITKTLAFLFADAYFIST